jgi:hypothetical protein
MRNRLETAAVISATGTDSGSFSSLAQSSRSIMFVSLAVHSIWTWTQETSARVRCARSETEKDEGVLVRELRAILLFCWRSERGGGLDTRESSWRSIALEGLSECTARTESQPSVSAIEFMARERLAQSLLLHWSALERRTPAAMVQSCETLKWAQAVLLLSQRWATSCMRLEARRESVVGRELARSVSSWLETTSGSCCTNAE